MKNILMAIGSSEIGGGQRVFLATVKELIKMNFIITVALPEGPLADSVKCLGINYHIVDFRSIKCLRSIKRILKKSEFDIINTYLTKCSLFVSFVNLSFRFPICCTLLNSILHEKQNVFQRAVSPLMYFLLSKMCDGIVVNSAQNKRHFIERAKIAEKSIEGIYSGIELDPFLAVPDIDKTNDVFVIGFVGRLSPEKGAYYLLEALTYLKGVDYRCYFVGDGPLRSELEQYASDHDLHGKVDFLGFRAEVPPLINQMDVVVVPSINETFGITIIEAFALRKAVIASNVGGIPELVKDKITGLLFPARDAVSLAEKISYIYHNKAEAIKMGGNGFDLLKQKFTSEAMARNTVAYYRSMIQSLSPKRRNHAL